MPNVRAFALLVLLGVGLALSPALAHQDAPGRAAGPEAKDDTKPQKDATGGGDLAVTHHIMTVGGVTLEYTATAGYMTLPDYNGKPRANIFFVAYTKVRTLPASTDPNSTSPPPTPIDPATRPITFAYNGGPGSASVWLHLGALGPRRAVMGEDGLETTPPYKLADNESTWLDFTDLVFIDPVSTGYSRPVEGESAKQFHGLDEDIQSVGDFIRLYTTRYQRWASPKFLAGESYGTTRSAGLSGYLQDTHGMYLNGISLISMVLNFQTLNFNTGNDVPYPLFLPTYTATAWYHKRLPADLQADFGKTIAEVQEWALHGYSVALAKGDSLSGEERAEVVRRLSRYTGLSEAFVENSNLRIRIFNFTKELLRDKDMTVGRLDSRFTGVDADSIGSSPEYDPSMSAITGPYTACLNDYMRRELAYENDNPYEILTGRVQPWSYASAQNRYVNVAETLRGAMARNKALKVFVAAGYYDLATPFFAAEYTLTHLGLPADRRANVTVRYYDAGHMMYVRLPDLEKLKADAAEFYRGAVGK